MDGISYRICLAIFFVHWSSRYSIQPYYSIPFDWKDANLLLWSLLYSIRLDGFFLQLQHRLEAAADHSTSLSKGHCWDKARCVECLICLGPAQRMQVWRRSMSCFMSGWARPNQNEIWKSDKCLESGKEPGWKCTRKYLQPKNFLHKVSNFFRLQSGQQAKAKATFRRNLRIVARLICYSCFSRLMRLRQTIQTYMQKTHLLSACFEECLHSNSCSLLQWDGFPASCSLRAAKKLSQDVSS